ncbi:MAG: LemA family protein [Candidatus Sumerlaeia bacterium]|nr:LemA family protein [Candidatus Sumerlaeia bacterium]
MEPFLCVLFAPGLLAGVWLMLIYNSLVRHRNHVAESWSGIDTELKRRYDLIPNLVSTVKGYAAHEAQVLEAVARARAASGSGVDQRADAERSVVSGLRTFLAVAESYPQLKADAQFLALQRELAETENRIQAARRFYNANVRDLNNLVQSFPSNLVASTFGFRQSSFFEVESALEREAPKVAL